MMKQGYVMETCRSHMEGVNFRWMGKNPSNPGKEYTSENGVPWSEKEFRTSPVDDQWKIVSVPVGEKSPAEPKTFDFVRAVRLASGGEKIRPQSWSSGRYLLWDSDAGLWKDNEGDEIDLSPELVSRQWELYREPEPEKAPETPGPETFDMLQALAMNGIDFLKLFVAIGDKMGAKAILGELEGLL